MRIGNLETKQKQTSKLDEGLRENDLDDLVLSTITIDDFEPKSGSEDEVVVVTFRAKDDEPANDLASFIEKGSHDILDTEVSLCWDQKRWFTIWYGKINSERRNEIS